VVAAEDGQGLAWLHENTEILERRTEENGSTVATVRFTPGKEPRFLKRFPEARRL
jgi:GTP-binding protein HflX